MDEMKNKTPVENLRRTLDIQGDKLNQITSNNREVYFSSILLINKFSFFLVNKCSKSISSIKI